MASVLHCSLYLFVFNTGLTGVKRIRCVKHSICSNLPCPHPACLWTHERFFTLRGLGDLSALPQKFHVSLQRRAGSSSALRVKWLCGCFCSPGPGSLPVTVLWTSSSWGPSTAKDRWQARAEKSPPPPPLSTPPPALFVFLFLSASLSSLSYVTGQNLSAKNDHTFLFPAEFCFIILRDMMMPRYVSMYPEVIFRWHTGY